MIKLSVVIITFNEDKNIARCIESVQVFADEILVVDSFSTDNTQQICSEYKVRFLSHPFEGHIQQKNYAASMASNNYVLSLDADEVVSPKLAMEIIEIKQEPKANGYYLNRLNNYCGKWIRHCGWYPDKKLRLWDRTKGAWGGENPHDKYELEPGCSTKFLKGDLLHYTFHSIGQHVDTINKFSGIMADQQYKKQRKTNIFKIILTPLFKFLSMYFIKLGFLDGYYGFVICLNSAYAQFLKEVKLKTLYTSQKK